MPLPTPNLDDRTWQDIVDEAKKMIPALCPQWTDFNPSDPGMTLVELLAFMTEMMIYRLNRVPEKNYIKFMELMGITLKPPKSAFTWLVFDVAEGAKNVELPVIPANTAVSGKNDRGETIVFETLRPLNLTAARLVKIYTQKGERYSDHTNDILSHFSSTPGHIFEGGEPVPHYFYLGHPDINRTGEDFKLVLFLTLNEPGVALHLEWTCWDGEGWRFISPALDETGRWTQSGRIEFDELPPMRRTEVNGITGFFLRIGLQDYDGAALPKIRALTMALELKKKSGIVPDCGYLSTRDIPFVPVVFHGPFYPFGREARENDALYISSEAFARHNAPVVIDVVLALSYTPPPISDIQALQVSWEYSTPQGDWKTFGLTSPQGVLQSRSGFTDKTEAFTRKGRVSFYVPADITPLEILGEHRYWIRVRISQGSYRRPAIKYKEIVKEQDKPPLITRFLIFFKEKAFPFNQYLAYNDFTYRDLTLDVARQKTIAPFVTVSHQNPELYLAFDSPFSNRKHRMFFRLKGSVTEEKGASIIWEYTTANGWSELKLLEDKTHDLTKSGLVTFIGPVDWQVKSQFGQNACWMRLRWGTPEESGLPHIRLIHLNIVAARNHTSHRGEKMGASNGQPYQSFSFHHSPILPGPHILVKELETSVPREIEDFKKKVKEKVHEETNPDDKTKKILWVEWQEVHNFFYSGRKDRHYIADIYNGSITFGDAIHGEIPPVGAEIKALIYFTGGGSQGNMGRTTINNLHNAFPYVDCVRNPGPAVGGTDRETIEAAKLRAPWEVRHRHRAVTLSDYEELVSQIPGVARVICLSEEAGKVKLIVLPEGDDTKLEPSDTLKEEVRLYLDTRRLLTTMLEIKGPDYTDFTVRAAVVTWKGWENKFPELRNNIEEKMHTMLHPLKGGLSGNGWPIGRAVYKSDLVHIIDSTRGIDHINYLTIDDCPNKEKVELGVHAFPLPTRIDLIQEPY